LSWGIHYREIRRNRAASLLEGSCSDPHNFLAMSIECFVPILSLKVGIAGRGLLVLVIQDRTD